MKIIVLTTTLSQGGITSFLIPLVNLLTELGHEVTLAYTKDEGKYISRCNKSVNYIKYNTPSRTDVLKIWLKHLAFYDMSRLFFRRSKSKPYNPSVQRLNYITAQSIYVTDQYFDVAISTAEGFCNAVVANKINSKRKIGWVHPDMGEIGLDVKAGKEILDKLNYVVAVSESGYNSLVKFYPEDRHKIVYIENLMDVEYINQRGLEPINDTIIPTNCMIIVTVCRIANEAKRLDRVVKVASILKEKKNDFRWYVIGDGQDKDCIQSLISKNGLEQYVILTGGKNNPLPYVKKADCFVLTSQYEGKPIAVEEAKILHTPVIVTEYTSAHAQVPKELGVVVSNKDGELEHQMVDLLMDDNWLQSIKCSNHEYEYSNKQNVELIKKIIQ